MGEELNQSKFYSGDLHPHCPLAGTGKCCGEIHEGKVRATITKCEKENEGHTDLPLEPKGENRLWIYGIWQTHIGYNHKLLSAMAKVAIERKDLGRATHLLDLLAFRKGIHTPANPDCPFLTLLREHKI